ncbi:MAG: hypothetical protein HKN03_06360 [Acidimicrobiales bacterium]|nr:hypothetical protein [Acidimicrobiales bacterium]
MFWDWFLAAKFVGAVALAVGLGWVWTNSELVTSAYTDERAVQALTLQPLSFSVATIPPSDDAAFELAPAPDTGNIPLTRLAVSDPVVTKPVVRGGDARLSGHVRGLGPDDVGQVRLTRITDGGSSDWTVGVNADGSWTAPGIHGGRYRIRALVPNLRASNGSTVLFLGEGQRRELNLAVTTPPEGLVFELVAADELPLGSDSVVAVTVGRQTVDGEGRSVLAAVPGVPVQATFSSLLSTLSANVVSTDPGGAARFLVRCGAPGRASVTFVAGDQTALLTLPPCVAPVIQIPPAVGDAESTDG